MPKTRPYAPEDVPAIKALLAELQKVEAAHQPVRKASPTAMADDVWEETSRLLADGKAHVVVAEADGLVVGVGIGFESQSSDLSLTVEARRTGYISDLVIAPGLRGKGLGRAILGDLFARFRERGLKTARIAAISENAGAIKLYQEIGFKPVSIALERSL